MAQTILLIDDTIRTQTILAQELRLDGYDVTVAQDQATMLALFDAQQFDCIVFNVDMPGIATRDLIDKVASLRYEPGVILATSDDPAFLYAHEDQALSVSVNIIGEIRKPMNPADIVACLSGISVTRYRNGQSPETVLDETEFMRGLVSDGLMAVYQPRLDVASGKVIGAEAFARWKSPAGGLYGAGAVVKIAREKGYVEALTCRMLELATEQLHAWNEAGHAYQISVNVEGENLRKIEFPDIVSGLVDTYGFAPEQLRLEITESDLDIDGSIPLEVLERLHGRGFGLTLDDFGAGFATLLHLNSIPFDEVVIDRTFIGRAIHNDTAKTVLSASVDLAHKLGMRVVCEGIEHQSQHDLAKRLSADFVQGYHICKPLTVTEFDSWMAD